MNLQEFLEPYLEIIREREMKEARSPLEDAEEQSNSATAIVREKIAETNCYDKKIYSVNDIFEILDNNGNDVTDLRTVLNEMEYPE
jgi:hypothetical protein